MMARVTIPQPMLLTGRLVTDSTVVEDGVLVVDGDAIRYAGQAAELPAAWRDVPVVDAGDGDIERIELIVSDSGGFVAERHETLNRY